MVRGTISDICECHYGIGGSGWSYGGVGLWMNSWMVVSGLVNCWINTMGVHEHGNVGWERGCCQCNEIYE